MPKAVPASLRHWLEDARDWSETDLGPLSAWSPDLLTAVASSLPLGPIAILWGPRLLRVYGPEYAPIMGDRHPEALGQPVDEVWPEIWQQFAPLVREAWETQDIVTLDQAAVVLDRSGFDERVYVRATYSPICDHDSGAVLGIAVNAKERTGEILATRRAEALGHLGRVSVSKRGIRSAARRALTAAATDTDDLADAAVVIPVSKRRAKGPCCDVVADAKGDGSSLPAFKALTERVASCFASGCTQTGAGCRFASLDTATPKCGEAHLMAIPEWSDGSRAAAECRRLPGDRGADDVGRFVIALDPLTRQDDDQTRFLSKATDLISRVLRDARADNAEREHVESLQTALETNRTIGAAMGVLMAFRHVSPNEAFDLLRTESQNSNRKLYDVATDVLLTGTLPDSQGAIAG